MSETLRTLLIDIEEYRKKFGNEAYLNSPEYTPAQMRAVTMEIAEESARLAQKEKKGE